VQVSWDESMPPGGNWRRELKQARERADAVVVLVTPAALGSAPVAAEWSSSLDHSQRVIPALSRGVGSRDLPKRLADNKGVNLDPNFDAAVRMIAEAVSAAQGRSRGLRALTFAQWTGVATIAAAVIAFLTLVVDVL
jgi:TIR domain